MAQRTADHTAKFFTASALEAYAQFKAGQLKFEFPHQVGLWHQATNDRSFACFVKRSLFALAHTSWCVAQAAEAHVPPDHRDKHMLSNTALPTTPSIKELYVLI